MSELLTVLIKVIDFEQKSKELRSKFPTLKLFVLVTYRHLHNNLMDKFDVL